MIAEVYVSVRKLDGGYILDNSCEKTGENESRIFVSQQKLLSEIKRILSQDLVLNTETD